MQTFYGIVAQSAKGCSLDTALSDHSRRLFDSLVDIADILETDGHPDAEAVASFNNFCRDMCRYLVNRTGHRLCASGPCDHASCLGGTLKH
jgi:hypothetical protein